MSPLDQIIMFHLINEATELPPFMTAFLLAENSSQLMTEDNINLITE